MNRQTLDFIAANAGGDVRRLALQAGRYPDVDMPYALDQIAGRQTARRKLPSWAATEGIIYPPRLSMEQCSGEAAARYKADVARRLCGGGRLVDITGGFGVDFSFMARAFTEAVYVERQERLCDIARHNLPLLGLARAGVVCADGTAYLRSMPPADMVFADPARRDAAGDRTVAISDCTPDIAALRDTLLAKAGTVMVKLAPMLDWRKAAADLGGCVREAHIVSAGGECKELLLVMSARGAGLQVHCVNDGDDFAFDAADTDSHGEAMPPAAAPQAGCCLYEPNASVMKAGCFGLLERRTGTRRLAANSHLFVADSPVEHFPGRSFIIDRVTTMNRKELKKALGGTARANITVRNFPLTVAELRRRLKISEGGSVYIFATTLADRTHVLLVCSKI